MDKKRGYFFLAIIASCIIIFFLVTVLKGGNNKVQDKTENSGTTEKATIISNLKQKLSEARISDDSVPDMTENEISSAIDLLQKGGTDYKNISIYDLRHANDVVPEVKTYSDEDSERMTIIGDKPKSPLVYWVLPERIENGYNISIDAGNELIEPRYLYDWNYAMTYYAHDFDYLLRDKERLLCFIGTAYSELATDFNTFSSYHGLDADEYLSPGEEGRFVLLRWFKFKDSDKEGWAVCYVDVINDSNEKCIKRNCPIRQVLFEI